MMVEKFVEFLSEVKLSETNNLHEFSPFVVLLLVVVDKKLRKCQKSRKSSGFNLNY